METPRYITFGLSVVTLRSELFQLGRLISGRLAEDFLFGEFSASLARRLRCYGNAGVSLANILGITRIYTLPAIEL